ncbi:thiamine phosphate synthase [Subtercola frigoramans]|uniref:Thiamine-phosphate synthase n=1 Tax=Subtercola frigoramans TaxID=120298 RepID=A0ABS2L3W2_9MICO|nr:thiamine phosphate synthase [Subtercola frigoramans]MBM7471792.1 thiamine-phosphate pyrophosphorylase [Subtercola frigoramans]
MSSAEATVLRSTVLRPLDLSVYLVTDTRLCGAFGVAATVAAAIGAGATTVQLRDPDATDAELVTLGRSLVTLLTGTAIPLLVNDRVHLVEPIGAQGAHIGQSDLPVIEARQLLGPHALLGLSAQTLDHVMDARSTPPRTIDYLGVGPVWHQTTKPNAAPPCGLDGFAAIAEMSPWPCVAIGGIDTERIPSLRSAGAAGVAVVSAICGQPDVARATGLVSAAWHSSEH